MPEHHQPRKKLTPLCSRYATCLAFASRNCIVYASARRLEALTSLPASINRLVLDVSDPIACQAAVDRIIAAEGRIDVLVNNAGAGASGPLLDFSVDDAKACFEVNFFAPMRCVGGA